MNTFCRRRALWIFAWLLGSMASTVPAATHTWTGGGGAQNAGWSAPSNWNGGVPTTGEVGGTIVQFNAGSASLMNINGLVVDQILFTGSGNTINGSTPLGVDGSHLVVNILDQAGGNTINSPIALQAGAPMDIECNTGTLTLHSNLSGTQALIFGSSATAIGTVLVTGDNSFNGKTSVNHGTLQLNSPGTAIPGSLTIGTSFGAAGSAVVQWKTFEEIANNANVTINSDGVLDLNGQSETVNLLSILGGQALIGNGTMTCSGTLGFEDGSLSVSASGKVNANSGIAMTGGSVTGQGTLSLGGDVIAISSGLGSAVLGCSMTLNGTHTFNINAGSKAPDLTLSGQLSDGLVPSGLFKNGAGTLLLSAATGNTYTGTTTVDSGVLQMKCPSGASVPAALIVGNNIDAANSAIVRELLSYDIASNAAVTVNASGQFDLNGSFDLLGSLAGNGNVILGSAAAGTLTVGENNSNTNFSGNISGNGALIKAGSGTLTLSGSDTYTGATTVNGGTLLLNSSAANPGIPGALTIGLANGAPNSCSVVLSQSNQLSNTGAVTINAAGQLNLAGFNATIGSLQGSGSVALGNAGTLFAGNDNTSTLFSGVISGAGGLHKTGSGTLTLSGNNAYTNATTVDAGTLLINGAQPASVVAVKTGAIFGGTGSVGTVIVTSATLSPGSTGGGVGKLFTGSLALDAGSTLVLDIPSTAAGAFDALAVTGTVTLGGCAVQFNSAASLPSPAAVLRLIDNDAADLVSGIFSGKPDGTVVMLGGVSYTLTYHGGTGNDVELQLANQPPQIVSAAGAVPNPAGVGQTVALAVSASDANQDTLTYTWAFGDGTIAFGASVTHAYTAAGHYTASVIVSDGNGGTATSSTLVTVNAPLVGSGNDSDGDGFSDGFETEVGTSPTDASSTPLHGLSAASAVNQSLNLTKASVKLNFAAAGKDAISFAGALDIPDNFAVSGQRVLLNFGGVVRNFSLASTGAATGSDFVFKLRVKSKKGVVLAQQAKFSAALNKGSFAAALADEGLTGATSVTAVQRPINIVVLAGNTIYQTNQALLYTAKAGKSGMAK